MSDATDAILDIQDALEEYGSDITLQIITQGAFNSNTGMKEVVIVPFLLKAIISTYSNKEAVDPNIHPKDIKFRFYSTQSIGYTDKILFQGDTYSIERFDKKIFQNENLIYTIQGRK